MFERIKRKIRLMKFKQYRAFLTEYYEIIKNDDWFERMKKRSEA